MWKIIAAMQVSLDGFIEGPNEELDWVDSLGRRLRDHRYL